MNFHIQSNPAISSKSAAVISKNVQVGSEMGVLARDLKYF
jgi:hypothetical protein